MYQGTTVENRQLIRDFSLVGLIPAKAGEKEYSVKFNIDKDGILSVEPNPLLEFQIIENTFKETKFNPEDRAAEDPANFTVS